MVKGKHYYEAEMTDEGLCRLGWSTLAGTVDLGTDKHGFGFGGTAKKSVNRQFDDYGERYGCGDVLGCYIDLDQHEISYTKNGVDLGRAFTIPPAMHQQAFYPACVIKNAELRFNFGASVFRFPAAGRLAEHKGLDLAAPGERVSAAQGSAGALKGKHPLALILEPSKELAQQTLDQIRLFKKHLAGPGLRDVLLIGGQSAKDQVRAIQSGVDIVVATPGRLDDLVKSGKLNLSQIRFYILDEVDGLIRQNQARLLEDLFKRFTKVAADGSRLQVIAASATLHSPEVRKFAQQVTHHPTWVDLKGQDSVPDTVHHCVVPVNPSADDWRKWQYPVRPNTDEVHARDQVGAGKMTPEALSQAVKILKFKYVLAAIDKHEMEQAIIFCRTRLDCDNLEEFLLAVGGGTRVMVNAYSCACVHSDRRDRNQNLQAFKNGELRFLICTDVIARGIDIRGVPFVINVTLPDEKVRKK